MQKREKEGTKDLMKYLLMIDKYYDDYHNRVVDKNDNT